MMTRPNRPTATGGRGLRHTLRVVALVAASGLAAAQTGGPTPAAATTAVTADAVWDLTPLYPDDAAWERERQALARDIPGLAALRGRIGRDAASLRAALELRSSLIQRLNRLRVYASTQQSTDNANPRHQERSALVQALGGQFGAASAWIEPEILAIGAAKIAEFQTADPRLAPHATALRQVLARAPHTLTPEAESTLAAMGPVLGTASRARELLINADIVWPTLTIDGRPVLLDDSGYSEWRRHPDRAVRRQVFETFWKTYGQYESTLGLLLAQRVSQGVITARLRQYPSAAGASLASVEVPEAVLRTLVAQANEGLPVLHRYFRLRQRMLKLPDLQYHDIYPNLVESSERYPAPRAADLTLAATRPLGDEYQRLLREALGARTMHVRPAKGKSGGAYATSVHGLTPYIFLNHTDDFESLVTFAHEWGHGMHSVLSQRAQPPETSGYPLFLAEIASTTNEVLLTDHMLRQARTPQERIFVLSQVLERIRAGFFRQTMFAEFELLAHDAQQRGEALSGRRFTDLYCGLLRRYHGAEQGVMRIDPVVCREWAFIPHFHRPFYVYAYATSATAAQFFGERILAGEAGARDAYLDVLRGGGSVPPHEALKKAGLDLTTPGPYQLLFRRMDAVMDEIERLMR